MRAGQARHLELEAEVHYFIFQSSSFMILDSELKNCCSINLKFSFMQVIKKDEVQVQSQEDTWAIKFMNFIYRANQLLSEGLTRELPL